jgi:hypothetical protein
MMCRVIAPIAALFRREAASRLRLRHPSSVARRLRIARHRAIRWFQAPIAALERERRERAFGPSLWRYGFRPWPALMPAEIARARRRGTRRASPISIRTAG